MLGKNMDDCSFILNVDKALLSLIWNGLKEDPKTQVLISNEKQISFTSPKTGEAGSKKLSIFLYSIVEDTASRNLASKVEASGKRISQISFSLHYLVTPCSGNEESDHLLLGKIIQIFANSPVLPGDAADNGAIITIKQDSLSLLDLNNLWTAVGAPLKACASYTISPVSINCSSRAQEKTETVVDISQPSDKHESNV